MDETESSKTSVVSVFDGDRLPPDLVGECFRSDFFSGSHMVGRSLMLLLLSSIEDDMLEDRCKALSLPFLRFPPNPRTDLNFFAALLRLLCVL
jgi:hypothetical protein